MTEYFDEKAVAWDDNAARVERAAAVAHRIMERISLTPEMDVLDFGSGTGLLGFNLLPRVASVTFADPSEGMLAQVTAKLQAVDRGRGVVHRLDPAALALPGRYHAVVSLMALHHVPDPAAALGLLADHLEPGGWLALSDLDREDGSFHDDPSVAAHYGFDRAELLALVERTGLERAEVGTVHTIRKTRGAAVCEYPLFLLTARRPRRWVEP